MNKTLLPNNPSRAAIWPPARLKAPQLLLSAHHFDHYSFALQPPPHENGLDTDIFVEVPVSAFPMTPLGRTISAAAHLASTIYSSSSSDKWSSPASRHPEVVSPPWSFAFDVRPPRTTITPQMHMATQALWGEDAEDEEEEEINSSSNSSIVPRATLSEASCTPSPLEVRSVELPRAKGKRVAERLTAMSARLRKAAVTSAKAVRRVIRKVYTCGAADESDYLEAETINFSWVEEALMTYQDS
jgi:hypothetical protein